MSARNISTKLALRFVAGAFKRGDYALALYWSDVLRENLERHARGGMPRKHRRTRKLAAKAQQPGFARTFAHPRDAQDAPVPSRKAP